MKCCYKVKISKKIKIITFTITAIMLLFFYFIFLVNPLVVTYSNKKINALAINSINVAILNILKDDTLYDRIMNITRSESGEILLIQTNSLEINKLAREITIKAQNCLEEIGSDGVNIPLGAFTGMAFLSGFGPFVNVNIVQIGAITTTFESVFVSSGINQTNHRIYLNINSNVSVMMPVNSNKVQTSVQLLLCESIIVGKIPNTYLMAEEKGDMLNLIPD